MKYDFIIAGSGCAGLSLLYHLLQEPTLQNKSILILDKEQKNSNDRTWCFWEKEPGPFEAIVHAKWNTLEFLSTNYKAQLDLASYTYKMIQGIDFYEYVLKLAKKFTNVSFLKEPILSITSAKNSAIVTTEKNTYTGTYVFNSTGLFNPKMTEENSLLQHFKGWVIETKEPVFDAEIGRLMDFSVCQDNGTTFMYVLPTSKTTALIEYTLFSKKILAKEKYTLALEKYILEDLNINDYTIAHEEFGVIPMSLAKFKKNPMKNVINIGTAGGFTKASTGYTFQFIQKDVAEIIANLKAGNNINTESSFKKQQYAWYDRTLIDVLLTEKLPGRQVFSMIFNKNEPEKILAFLANESKFIDDIAIMSSLPIGAFLTSGIKQLRVKN
jgi:lycopene beta-cyclase